MEHHMLLQNEEPAVCDPPDTALGRVAVGCAARSTGEAGCEVSCAAGYVASSGAEGAKTCTAEDGAPMASFRDLPTCTAQDSVTSSALATFKDTAGTPQGAIIGGAFACVLLLCCAVVVFQNQAHRTHRQAMSMELQQSLLGSHGGHDPEAGLTALDRAGRWDAAALLDGWCPGRFKIDV